MADKKDYYDILGAKKGADDATLKKAYRDKALKFHPDVNKEPDAEERMKEINEAYEVLKDPQKRAAYDQYGHAAFSQGTAGGPGGPFGGGGGAGGAGMRFDFGGDIFGDLFGDFFGGGAAARQNGPRRGRDMELNMEITLEEAVFGTEKTVSLNVTDNCDVCKGSGAKPGTTPESCKRCNGTGQVRTQGQTIFGGITTVIRDCPDCRGTGKITKEPCAVCGGTGAVRKNKKLEVKIPKGVDSGQTIVLNGIGDNGVNGGGKGNIHINIYVKRHNTYRREGLNLYTEYAIPVTAAILGADVIIPTLYGDEKYTIKAGTQPEMRITLKGKGVPHHNNSRTVGDLVVTVKVNIPTSLTDRQKEIIREFAGDDRDVKQPTEGKAKKKGLFGGK